MRKHAVWLLLVAGAWRWCAAHPGPELPNQVVINASHSGWSSSSTNLTLRLTNGVYAAGIYTVAPALVSNLLAAARFPWPEPETNKWPRFKIDPANLGLTADWLKANYGRLIEYYSGSSGKVPFPNASEKQRVWLTNALMDAELLGEAVRQSFGGFWTDDYPNLELRFENDDGKTVEELVRLHTKAQQVFMLPWQVEDGTKKLTSANAEISRAVVNILPPGFLLRDRLNGNLLRLVTAEFLRSSKVNEFLRQSTLELTFGTDPENLQQVFQIQRISVSGSKLESYPDQLSAVAHRTNWPERVTFPVETKMERGIATGLNKILAEADSKAVPVLQQEWLVRRLEASKELSIEVQPASPDQPWLREHMGKAGLLTFYDRIRPDLRLSQGFLLREKIRRASYWAVMKDGRLLLYGFSGDGVLDWKPQELGFAGEQRQLSFSNINRVGVFVGPDGGIKEVAAPEQR